MTFTVGESLELSPFSLTYSVKVMIIGAILRDNGKLTIYMLINTAYTRQAESYLVHLPEQNILDDF